MRAKENKLRILGVDPGLSITGYGCINLEYDNFNIREGNIKLIEAGVIRTKPKDPIEKRLAIHFNDFSEIIEDFKPDVIVIEDLYSHYKNPRTAIIMGHVRGTIITAAGIRSLKVVSYSANRIKSSLTGNGHASKEQVQRMIKSVLGLDSVPAPADVADALAGALCHANAVNRQTAG
jgi:crossover junction endodeoxyribonuclease RuvC